LSSVSFIIFISFKWTLRKCDKSKGYFPCHFACITSSIDGRRSFLLIASHSLTAMERGSEEEEKRHGERKESKGAASSGVANGVEQPQDAQKDSTFSSTGSSRAQQAPAAQQPRSSHPPGSHQASLPSSPSPFNLAGMMGTLPDYGSPHAHGYQQGNLQLGTQSSQMPIYPHQQGIPFSTAPAYSTPAYPAYGQPQYGPPLGQSPGSHQFASQMSYLYQNQRPPGNVPYGGQYQQPSIPYYYPQSVYPGPSGSPTTYQPATFLGYPANLRVGAPVIVSDSMGSERSPVPGGSSYSSPAPPFETGWYREAERETLINF
jgi:hypothetical protein